MVYSSVIYFNNIRRSTMNKTLSPEEVYNCLAENTKQSLEKVLDNYPIDMENIVFRAIAQSPKCTPKMMEKMLHETEFGFKEAEKKDSLTILHRASPRREHERVSDPHNFRTEALLRLKTFAQSPAVRGNESEFLDVVASIARYIPGERKDITDVYIATVNAKTATEHTLSSVYYKLYYSDPQKNENKKSFAQNALKVFAATLSINNRHKQSEESLCSYYNAISRFASIAPQEVDHLIKVALKSDKNTDRSRQIANQTLQEIPTVMQQKSNAPRTI